MLEQTKRSFCNETLISRNTSAELMKVDAELGREFINEKLYIRFQCNYNVGNNSIESPSGA